MQILYYLLSNQYNYFYIALVQKYLCAQHRDINLLAHRSIDEKIRSFYCNTIIGF